MTNKPTQILPEPRPKALTITIIAMYIVITLTILHAREERLKRQLKNPIWMHTGEWIVRESKSSPHTPTNWLKGEIDD